MCSIKSPPRKNVPIVDVKTFHPSHTHTHIQFECEFRRFSVDRNQMNQFDAFYSLVKDSHHLPSEMPFTVSYTDPRNGDLLPITNNDNLMRAYTTAMPLLRLVIYRQQGEEECSPLDLEIMGWGGWGLVQATSCYEIKTISSAIISSRGC